MFDLRGIAEALGAFLPAGIGLGWADPQHPQAPLWPGETLHGAVQGRRREFAAGRAAARQAMAAIGQPAAAIQVGADRAPIWPPGLTGSICHCHRVCLAIVGIRAEWLGLGIDIEPETALPPELWPSVLRPEEIAALPAAQGLHATRIFVAKEAAYKAQYSQSRTLFGFDTLRITFDAAGFLAEFTAPVPPFSYGDSLRGIDLSTQNHRVALVAISA